MADLEAGTGTVLRLRPGMADAVVVVAQPTVKAIDVAARAARTARHRQANVVLVANRVTTDADVQAVRDRVDHDELVVVADDPGIAAADREGEAPIDAAPDSPGVTALVGLAERLAAGS